MYVMYDATQILYLFRCLYLHPYTHIIYVSTCITLPYIYIYTYIYICIILQALREPARILPTAPPTPHNQDTWLDTATAALRKASVPNIDVRTLHKSFKVGFLVS